MVVVADASALIWAGTEDATEVTERLRAEAVHAPQLIDAEIGNALRTKQMRGELTAEHATSLLWALPGYIDVRHAARGSLAGQAWALRHNLTFYDALYVAVAAAVGAPLLTLDRALTRAPNLPCEVELIT